MVFMMPKRRVDPYSPTPRVLNASPIYDCDDYRNHKVWMDNLIQAKALRAGPMPVQLTETAPSSQNFQRVEKEFVGKNDLKKQVEDLKENELYLSRELMILTDRLRVMRRYDNFLNAWACMSFAASLIFLIVAVIS
jgi:hypothetical protein